MKLTKEHAKMVKEQLKNDCSFFEKNSIIDYSFLVGVHHNFLNKQDSLCVDQMDSISNEIFMPSKFVKLDINLYI